MTGSASTSTSESSSTSTTSTAPSTSAAPSLSTSTLARHPADDVEVDDLVERALRAIHRREQIELAFAALAALPFTAWATSSTLMLPVLYAIMFALTYAGLVPVVFAPVRLVQHQLLHARCRAAGVAPKRVTARVEAARHGRGGRPPAGPALSRRRG